MFSLNVRFYDNFKRDSLRGQEYYYLSYDYHPVGSTVVVDTRNGLALAEVTSIPTQIPNIPAESLRTVVCRVPVGDWYAKEIRRGNQREDFSL